MGFGNPQVPWIELEHQLSDRGHDGRPPGSPPWTNAGGDSPAWSRRRQPYKPPPSLERRADAVPYAELHCHSNFSFLDGASHPEELAEEAARLGLDALALTDHDGFYGVVRFAEAAREVGMPTVFGTELTLGATTPQNGVADPEGTHLLVLATGPDGYARLGRAISHAQMAGEKGAPRTSLAALADENLTADGRISTDWWVLSGCRKGAVCSALIEHGPAAAERELHRLVDAFGRDRIAVELWDHGDPLDSARNDALAEIAVRNAITCIATNNVHYATPARRPLATALAAVRARRSLDEIDPWLPGGAGAHLRSGAEQSLPRRRRGRGRARACVRVRPRARRAEPAPVPVPAAPRRDELAARAHLAWCGAALRAAWRRSRARRL